MDNKNFHNYKKLKNELTFIYKGFNIGNIVSISIWNWANKSIPIWYIKYFFNKIDFSFFNQITNKYIIYNDIPRKDHEATFLNIANKISDKYITINKVGNLHPQWTLSIKNIFLSIHKVFSCKNELSWYDKIKVSAYICMYLNTIDFLLKKSPKIPKVFVAYSVVHETQNLLAQYFEKNGAKVIGLTHGVNYIYKNNIPIDCINYENLNFDCLVWSETTYNEYINYGLSPSCLHIAGYPKPICIKEMKKLTSIKKILILLCRATFDQSNIRLLQMLQPLTNKYSIYLKLHPSNNFTRYNTIAKSNGFIIIPEETLLINCLDNSKFDIAIAVNTTSYYEILAAGIPCFRFEDGNEYDLAKGICQDKINNLESFIKGMQWLTESLSAGTYELERKKILYSTLGVGIDRYREILVNENAN